MTEKEQLNSTSCLSAILQPSAELESSLPLTPLPDPCDAVRRASRCITHLYDVVLEPSGLKATQFITLQAIAAHGQVAQWRLSREHGTSVETLSRQLGTLRRRGLVELRRGEVGTRERLYHLTASGARKVEEATPYWRRAQQRLRQLMGEPALSSALEAASHLAAAALSAESARLPNVSEKRAAAGAGR